MTIGVECPADFFAKPISERITLNKGMESDPTGEEDQQEQRGNEDQKSKAFQAKQDEVYGTKSPAEAERYFPRLFGYLDVLASGVVTRRPARSIEREFAAVQQKRKRI